MGSFYFGEKMSLQGTLDTLLVYKKAVGNFVVHASIGLPLIDATLVYAHVPQSTITLVDLWYGAIILGSTGAVAALTNRAPVITVDPTEADVIAVESDGDDGVDGNSTLNGGA